MSQSGGGLSKKVLIPDRHRLADIVEIPLGTEHLAEKDRVVDPARKLAYLVTAEVPHDGPGKGDLMDENPLALVLRHISFRIGSL